MTRHPRWNTSPSGARIARDRLQESLSERRLWVPWFLRWARGWMCIRPYTAVAIPWARGSRNSTTPTHPTHPTCPGTTVSVRRRLLRRLRSAWTPSPLRRRSSVCRAIPAWVRTALSPGISSLTFLLNPIWCPFPRKPSPETPAHNRSLQDWRRGMWKCVCFVQLCVQECNSLFFHSFCIFCNTRGAQADASRRMQKEELRAALLPKAHRSYERRHVIKHLDAPSGIKAGVYNGNCEKPQPGQSNRVLPSLNTSTENVDWITRDC